MKRTIISIIALASVAVSHGQTAKELERAGFVRDSVAEVLAEHRANYAKNESMRERLAPMILSLEKEVVRLQSEYDRLLSQISQSDVKKSLTAYEEAKQQAANTKKEQTVVVEDNGAYIPDKARMKRDLVKNDYFAERLAAVDYKTLCDAQKSEATVKSMVAKYHTEYAELLALQRLYMEVPTRTEADSVAQLFAAKRGVMVGLDEEITSLWSSLYFNKIYAYDLLMERSGNSAMLDLSAAITARAEREVNENSDLYESDALVNYYVRKRALTEYETKIASTLSLTTSRDSLKVVATELGNRDYKVSKLSLQRRSFIKYENIEVKVPTIYNSKNPVPQTKIYDYGTVYRIRVGLFSKRPNISALRGVMPLSYTDAYNKGLYAYFVGGFRTEQEAKEGVAYLKKLGFRDPIIAVWVDGEYYPTLEDMRRSQSQYNVEISGVPTLTDDVKAKILSHKADCTISRIGSTFVVGSFEGKSAAEAVAADLKAMSSEIVVEITKKP
ncbi:MAG: hypothetical protein E7129_01510 [Rikenellaceae bacterium]|nr:hypothetical protein [Rikenellaceae bacterium]